MPLLATTLAAALLAEFEAGTSGSLAFANAWATYFKTATLAGAPPVPALVDAGAAQLKAALTLTSNSSASDGAALIRTSLTAFWTHLQANAAAYWPGATPGAPSPGLASVDAALLGAFAANLDAATTSEAATTRLADALHLGGVGGSLTLAGTPIPIL